MTALTLCRLNLCDGVHIGSATKMIFLPNNPLDVLLSAKEMETYLFLEVILQILTTLPVSTATNERSFSASKYLKTYLRSTMKEARLNVHRNLNIDYEHVIDEFSRKNRRLNFN